MTESYSLEIHRLNAKNIELVSKLKKIGQEVDKMLTRVPIRKEKGKSDIEKEVLLHGELDCLDKETEVLTKEIKILNLKVKKDTSGEAIIELETQIAVKQKQVDILAKEVSLKQYNIRHQEIQISKIRNGNVSTVDPGQNVKEI